MGMVFQPLRCPGDTHTHIHTDEQFSTSSQCSTPQGDAQPMPYYGGEKGDLGDFSWDPEKIRAEINVNHGGEALSVPSHIHKNPGIGAKRMESNVKPLTPFYFALEIKWHNTPLPRAGAINIYNYYFNLPEALENSADTSTCALT